MKERILNYRHRIDKLLQADELMGEEWEKLLREHLQQLAFFQHERLVHLIVTMTVAVLAVLALGFCVVTESLGFLLASAMLIILFCPYIGHYMLLENEIQRMYVQHDRIQEQIRKTNRDGFDDLVNLP